PLDIPPKGGDGRGSGEGIRLALQEEAPKSGSAVRDSAAATPTMEAEVQTMFGKSISEIFVLTAEDVAHLQREMAEEAERDSLTDFTELLFQVLEVEDNVKDYTEIVGSVERAIRAFMTSGQFRCALQVLQRLKEVNHPEKNGDGYAEVIAQAIDRLGSEVAVKELSMALNAGRMDDLDALQGYLTLLNPGAILPLTDLLGMLEQMKVRRLLCDALAVLAKEHISLLVQRLQDPHWYVVRNVIYILGKIGDDRVIPSLKAVLQHPELRVRKELVHMLSEMSNPGVGDLLMSSLEDENPQIRVAALRGFIRTRDKTAAGRIREMIDGNDFSKKELSEKKEYFEATGRLLGNEAIPFLKDHLMKTGWWGRSHLDEMRFCASLGLKRIGTPEALAVLQEGSASRDKMIRKLSLDALGEGKGNDA
ncbi:MAG: HEAT repeat domain-containing protein, partial [Nitrospirae bacterium]|nr:HEAT repeat domain-containing protein [Nitrospirota bacterium]